VTAGSVGAPPSSNLRLRGGSGLISTPFIAGKKACCCILVVVRVCVASFCGRTCFPFRSSPSAPPVCHPPIEAMASSVSNTGPCCPFQNTGPAAQHCTDAHDLHKSGVFVSYL
jgi:hypothetical protein